jgi:hypothetical protein
VSAVTDLGSARRGSDVVEEEKGRIDRARLVWVAFWCTVATVVLAARRGFLTEAGHS